MSIRREGRSLLEKKNEKTVQKKATTPSVQNTKVDGTLKKILARISPHINAYTAFHSPPFDKVKKIEGA